MKEHSDNQVVPDVEQQEEQLNLLVYQALEQDGSLIPTTPEAVARAEAELDNEDLELPATLANFDAALRHASQNHLMNCMPLQIPTGTEENLARAAREGGDVPPEVEAQMRADRAASEDDANAKGQH